MLIAWHPLYQHKLPEKHKFPMIKYLKLKEKLLSEKLFGEKDFFQPEPVSEDILISTHDPDYWSTLKQKALSKKEERKMGFPQSDLLIERERLIMDGTLQGAVNSIDNKFAFNIAGGTHHAFTNKAEGFCLLNDIAIGANHLLDQGLAENILIIDLDVHQGNGTAQIFKNNPNVFTFSMHAEENYPREKEKSDLDIGLEYGIKDDEYLNLLETNLDYINNIFQADFVFFQSGVDILETDKFGRLSVSIEGCNQRDNIVFDYVNRLSVPVQTSMGGGYSEDVDLIVEAHLNTYRSAKKILS